MYNSLLFNTYFYLLFIKTQFWFFISLFQLSVILFLIYKLNFNKRFKQINGEDKIISDSKSNLIVMDNLMTDINKSKDLYKKLSIACHPDLFMDVELNKKANEIFQDITINQRNYNGLMNLKDIAEKELKIKIN